MPTAKRNERHIDEWVGWFVVRPLPVTRGARLRWLRKHRGSDPAWLSVNQEPVLVPAIVESTHSKWHPWPVLWRYLRHGSIVPLFATQIEQISHNVQ